jgi:DNA-binding transcriptional MerR regulator
VSKRESSVITLGRLAKTAKLSRATLLYYEAQGLLEPLQRSASGYRLYGKFEIERLHSIRRLRAAGLPLTTVRDLLVPRILEKGKKPNSPVVLLENRLVELCREAEQIREQQKLLAQILATGKFRDSKQRYGSKEAWVALLRRAGFSDADMHNWHIGFEAASSREHAAFLRSLGLSSTQVKAIRAWSKQPTSRQE